MNLFITQQKKGTYIENYQYFLHNPKHGTNETGTCGAISAQLLLSYHNYYSDRRIIKNKYLNGDYSNEKQYNPNYCNDPMSMNPLTIGTRGSKEDGSDVKNSYFNYIVNYINSGCTTGVLVNGLNSVLNDANKGISNGMISFNIGYKYGDNRLTKAVDTSGVINEIDEGRPVILLMQSMLGGLNHYVVAYGYGEYQYPNDTTKYMGFITHFGHGDKGLDIWVNASWVYSYITLKINHEHDYSVHASVNGVSENRCSVCKHRTDAAIMYCKHDIFREKNVCLPQNGYFYKTYEFETDFTAYYTFQTFGEFDTIIELYDSDRKFLKRNDDGGYKTNGYIQYRCLKDTKYYIKVFFFKAETYGYFNLDVYASSRKAYSYLTMLKYQASSLDLSWNCESSLTHPIVIIPTESGCYEINAIADFDTYIVLFDCGSSYSYQFDDDSGEGDNARLETYLEAGRSYIVIAAPYDINEDTGTINFNYKVL